MKSLKLLAVAAATVFASNVQASAERGLFEGSIQTINLGLSNQYMVKYFGDKQFNALEKAVDNWSKKNKSFKLKIDGFDIEFGFPPVWYYNLNVSNQGWRFNYRIALCGQNKKMSYKGKVAVQQDVPWTCIAVDEKEEKKVILFTNNAPLTPMPDIISEFIDVDTNDKIDLYPINVWRESSGADYACSPLLKKDYCPSFDEIHHESPDAHDI